MKKYSKLIALASILVIAIVVTVLVVYFNSIEKDNNFKLGDYTVVAQGAGVAIVTYDGEETSVEIPASIDNKKIVSIKEGAFNDTSVVTITFAEGANVEIEEAAFANNTTIQTVHLPSNMTSIPKNCFMGCSSLNEVTMPDSVTFIGSYAFAECTNLTKNYTSDENGFRWLNLPQNLKEICDHAFYNCTSLDCIKVTDKLELIDEYAFRGSYLQKISTYAEDDDDVLGITEIGNYAFYQSQIRLSLNMPALTKIGNYAFSSIQAVTSTAADNSFTVPTSVTSIGDYAFAGCSSLITFSFASDEEGDKELTLGKYILSSCISLEEVNFDRSVDTIPEGCFMGCVKLLSKNDLILPEEVQTIEPAAFAFYVTQSSNTKYCEKTIKFKRLDGEGKTQQVDYNDFFKVTQLTTFATSASASNTSKHFVVTDYYGTDSQPSPTTLYAYVGLYSASCTWQTGTGEATSFKFFVEGTNPTTKGSNSAIFGSLQTIKNCAFAGAQFEKLCLPGRCTDYEKNAFYKSEIDTIYIDSACLDYTCIIDKDAFDNLNSSLDEVTVLVKKGGSSVRDRFEASQYKAQLDAIQSEMCLLAADNEWPK